MDKITIVSPVGQVRFPSLASTEVFSGVDTGKYSLTLVFDPKDRKVLEDAITSAGGGRGKSPLKEIPADAQYDAGMLMLKAKTTYQVSAIDVSGNPIDLDKVTQGAEAQVKLTFQEYTLQGGGVTTYLGNIRLLKSGGTGDMDFGDLPDGYEPGVDKEDGEFNDPLPF